MGNAFAQQSGPSAQQPRYLMTVGAPFEFFGNDVIDARARVDEHDAPRRQALQQRFEVGGRHVRPRQVELRHLAVERHEGPAGVTLPHRGSDRVDVAAHVGPPIDVAAVRVVVIGRYRGGMRDQLPPGVAGVSQAGAGGPALQRAGVESERASGEALDVDHGHIRLRIEHHDGAAQLGSLELADHDVVPTRDDVSVRHHGGRSRHPSAAELGPSARGDGDPHHRVLRLLDHSARLPLRRQLDGLSQLGRQSGEDLREPGGVEVLGELREQVGRRRKRGAR